MCGIACYVGEKPAAPRVYAALKRLEYRGYDSAGIATLSGGKFEVVKCVGSVRGLSCDAAGNCAIGHTRWATHGAPSLENAHPHVYKRFAVVHNGILENEAELRAECLARGERFASETDSELIAHLLERFFGGDLLAALKETVSRLKGSFAIAAMCSEVPDTIVVHRFRSPLVVGVGDGVRCASDAPALATRDMTLYPLDDGESALLCADGVRFYGKDFKEIEKTGKKSDFRRDLPARGGYMHFMRKEIAEIPAVMAAARPALSDRAYTSFYQTLCASSRVHIVACGTAYHAGLAAAYAFETLARMPAETHIASEYRYQDPILPPGTLVLAVSQSGETADTIAAARLAKERGAFVAAVVNEEQSSLAALADAVLPVCAGREIAVAATKSFNAQLMLLYSLAASLAEARGRRGYGDLLAELPEMAKTALETETAMQSWAARFSRARAVYFIGRGADRAAALEGSLKFKEITYLPAEGYAAGELKHGALALIGEDTPVVAVCTSERLAEKTMSAVREASARGGKVYSVTSVKAFAEAEGFAGVARIPECGEIFSPALSVIPLQLLAYYTALARGNDPDRPRNLAKSVTVE